MIAKQRKGRGFRGLLEYVENKEEAERIGGNMSGRNPRELAAEFRFSRQLNPNVERAVYHVSLSLAPGEYLSDEQWNEISDRYLQEMNFHNNQYVVYRHGDRDNDHIHIVASRICLDDGRCVHDGWDYKRSEAVVRQLERDYNLQSVRGSHEKLERTATTGQHRRIEREQGEYDLGLRDNPPELPVKMQLQKIIDSVTALKEYDSTSDYLTMPMFIERLQGEGVEVRHGFTRNGKSKGISYSFLGQAFSGSHLGAAYTFPGLQKHKGVSYQSQRDDQAIEQLLLNRVNENTATEQLLNQENQNTVTGQLLNLENQNIVTGQLLNLENQNIVTEQFPITSQITNCESHDEVVSQKQQWQVIYQQICSKSEQFNDGERDYLIVKRLLQLGRPPEEIQGIINASAIARSQTEVKELMVKANLELQQEHQKQLRQQKKLLELEL